MRRRLSALEGGAASIRRCKAAPGGLSASPKPAPAILKRIPSRAQAENVDSVALVCSAVLPSRHDWYPRNYFELIRSIQN